MDLVGVFVGTRPFSATTLLCFADSIACGVRPFSRGLCRALGHFIMNDLNQTIINKFNATPALAQAISGGIWQDEAPAAQDSGDGAGFRPYCILNDLKGGQTDRDFNSKTIEPYAIQFSIHATPKMLCVGLAEALALTFDGLLSPASSNISMPGGALLVLFVRRYPIQTYVDPVLRDENGNKVWRSAIVYDATVQDT
jgi:hypothetical protein